MMAHACLHKSPNDGDGNGHPQASYADMKQAALNAVAIGISKATFWSEINKRHDLSAEQVKRSVDRHWEYTGGKSNDAAFRGWFRREKVHDSSCRC